MASRVPCGCKAISPIPVPQPCCPSKCRHWANGLINADRTARTVANVWVGAARTVFAWAIDEKLLSRNPFIGWRLKVPKKIRTRETKALTDDEIKHDLECRAGSPGAQ